MLLSPPGATHGVVTAVHGTFGTNDEEIKQKSLRAIRLLREAESAADEIGTHQRVVRPTCNLEQV